MYCKHCGNKVEDEAVVCVKCGCIVDETAFRQVQQKNRNVSNEYYNDTVMSFVKLLLVISCVIPALSALVCFGAFLSVYGLESFLFSGFIWLLSALFNIWVTYSIFDSFNTKKHITTGFKIVILIFCNLIAGIILLCSNADVV